MTNEIYHPDDRAKIEKAEADLARCRAAGDELERMLVSAKMVAAPTVRNRYAYHRKAEKHDPLTAAYYAVLGRLLYRV